MCSIQLLSPPWGFPPMPLPLPLPPLSSPPPLANLPWRLIHHWSSIHPGKTTTQIHQIPWKKWMVNCTSAPTSSTILLFSLLQFSQPFLIPLSSRPPSPSPDHPHNKRRIHWNQPPHAAPQTCSRPLLPILPIKGQLVMLPLLSILSSSPKCWLPSTTPLSCWPYYYKISSPLWCRISKFVAFLSTFDNMQD